MSKTSSFFPNQAGEWVRYILSLVMIGVIYVITGVMSGQIVSIDPQLPIIWIPSGITFAIVMLGGYRYVGGVVFGVVCLGLLNDKPVGALFILSISNSLTLILGAYILQTVLHIDTQLKRIRDVIGLVLVGGCGVMMVGAIAATFISSLALNYSSTQVIEQFLAFWIGSSLSVIFITPLIFTWFHDRTAMESWRKVIEPVGLIVVSVISGWVAYSNVLQLQIAMPILIFMLPPIIWVMVRFRLREVTLVNAIMIGFMIWGAQTPHNIISDMSTNNRIVFIWSTIAIGSVFSLIMKVLIDERRVIEQTLKTERDMNAQILEALGQGVGVLSQSGHYEYVNPAFANLLEMDVDDLIGLSPYEIIADSFKPKLDDIFKVRKSGQASSYQAVLKNSRGEEVTVLTTGVTRYTKGEYDGTISVITDIRPLLVAEQARIQSEQRFRAIFESSADGTVVIDESANILMANRAHQELVGYSAEELRNMKVIDYLNAEDSEQGRVLFQHAIDNKLESYQFELQYIRKDKTIRWIDASVGIVWSIDGNYEYTVVISRDITEARRTKLAIENSEKRFRAIFENASLPIAVTREDRKLSVVNPAFCEMVGYRATELEQMKFDDITYPGDNIENEVKFKQLIDGDINHFILTKRYVHKDQSVVWVRLTVSRFADNISESEDGDPNLYTIAIAENITERRLVEQDLQRSESFLRAVFENSAESVIVVDTSSLIVMSNRAHQNLVGYNADELSQMTVRDYIHPDDIDREEELFQQALKHHNDSYQLELRFIRRDKTIRWVEASVGLVWDKDGNYQHAIAVSRDITESRSIKLAIENSEKRFRAIFENASLPITVTRQDHSIEMANPAFCEMLGYTTDELKQMEFDDFTHPDDYIEDYSNYNQLVNREIDHFTRIKRYLHKDGTIVWVNLSISLFVTQDIVAEQSNYYTVAITENITERLRVENALKESEEWYRHISELMPDTAYSYLYDFQNDKFVLNRRIGYSKVSYFTEFEMTGSALDIYSEAERQRLLADVQATMDGQTTASEYHFMGEGGRKRWIYTKRIPMWNTDKTQIIGFYGTSHDITERKEAEIALRKSEEWYRHISELMSDIAYSYIYDLETGGFILSHSIGYAEVYANKFNISGLGIRANYTEIEQQRLLEDIQATMDGQISEDEYYFVGSDNQPKWMYTKRAPMWNTDKTQIIGFYGTSHDITERKEAEIALRASEEQYRTIFENSLVGMYRTTIAGRFLSVNPEIVSILGYDSVEELYDLDITTDVYLNAEERVENVENHIHHETGIVDEQVHLKKKNGDIILVQNRANVVRDTDDNALYFEGSIIDITEQHRQAEEIKQLNQDLEQRVLERTEQLELANKQLLELDKLRAKFIADMSHEMRTPLTVLNTRLYLMQHSKNTDNLERHIDGFRKQLNRLEEFVENAFDISVIDMSRDNIVPEEVSLNDIVESAVNALIPRADVDGLDLSYQLESTLPLIMGRERHLSQVATNLVSNAIKYTDEGKIEVFTGIDSVTHRVYLRVSDTGMGIAEEDIPHLFSRFYRGIQAGQSTISGSGLGLSIVKEIVDAHGGHIDIESQINEGTIFTVWLPIKQEPTQNTYDGTWEE
jgi:PAS domain S-box-containing protein